MKLSPLFTLFFFFGFISANEASKFAEDPELTIIAYFEPTCFAKSLSNL